MFHNIFHHLSHCELK